MCNDCILKIAYHLYISLNFAVTNDEPAETRHARVAGAPNLGGIRGYLRLHLENIMGFTVLARRGKVVLCTRRLVPDVT